MSAQKFLEVRSGYMNRAHDPKEIASALRLLRKHHGSKLEFDTLVGTGLSGSIVIPQIARSLRKKFLIVRKSTDRSHSWYPAEGVLGSRWLFVDDLIASGATLNNCVKAVDDLTRNHFSWNAELAGIFLYGDGSRDASLESASVERAPDLVDGFMVKRSPWEETTQERVVKERLCTGCDRGCEGDGCKGVRCRRCFHWCVGECPDARVAAWVTCKREQCPCTVAATKLTREAREAARHRSAGFTPLIPLDAYTQVSAESYRLSSSELFDYTTA